MKRGMEPFLVLNRTISSKSEYIIKNIYNNTSLPRFLSQPDLISPPHFYWVVV